MNEILYFNKIHEGLYNKIQCNTSNEMYIAFVSKSKETLLPQCIEYNVLDLIMESDEAKTQTTISSVV